MLSVKISILTIVITMIAAAVPFGVTFGQTEPDQTSDEVPSDLLATLQKDLKEDKGYRECLEKPDSPPLEGQVVVRRLDLNQPRKPALLLRGVMPCLGGNDNGELFLYIGAGKAWRRILHTWGQSLIVCGQAVTPCPVPRGSERRSTSRHGWPDLALWRHASAWEGDQLVYQFDGNVYKAVVCHHVQGQNSNGEPYSKPRYTPCGRGWKASE
jgi:hypothetical protein